MGRSESNLRDTGIIERGRAFRVPFANSNEHGVGVVMHHVPSGKRKRSNGRILMYGFENGPIERLAIADLRLICVTFDIKIARGEWEDLGTVPACRDLPWPVPGFFVDDHAIDSDFKYRSMKLVLDTLDFDVSREGVSYVSEEYFNSHPEQGQAGTAWVEQVLEQAVKEKWTGRRPIPGVRSSPMEFDS